MNEQRLSRFRLMTYNIGGGRKDLGPQPDAVVRVIEEVCPDILAIQEAASCQDADGEWHSLLSQIAQAGAFGNHTHFAPALSMREQMDIRKGLFVHGLFNDWQDWRQGNALLSRWEFVRLGDPSKRGTPRNIPLYSHQRALRMKRPPSMRMPSIRWMASRCITSAPR